MRGAGQKLCGPVWSRTVISHHRLRVINVAESREPVSWGSEQRGGCKAGEGREREDLLIYLSAENTASGVAAPGTIFSVRKLNEYNECTLCINSILVLHPRSNES